MAVRPGAVSRRSLLLPVCFFFGSAALYALAAYTAGTFTRWMGAAFLLIFCVYMALTVRQMKLAPEAAPKAEEDPEPAAERPLRRDLMLLIAGAAVIAVGARLLVDNGTLIAQALGVPDSVIGLTVVALGTSLPELITAITALLKGHSALSLGNVIGANLFNIVLVSGIAITISPFSVPAEKVIGGMNSSLVVDIPLMLGVMALLCVPALLREKLARWQGVLLLCIYAAFTAYQFIFQG